MTSNVPNPGSHELRTLSAATTLNTATSSRTSSIISKTSHDLLVRCWEAAIERYNSKLTNDPKKRLAISQQPRATFDSLFHAAEDAKTTMEKKRWKGGKVKAKVDAVFRAINRYAVVGDVLVQHHAEYTALAWGAFRGLLMVAVEESHTTEVLSDALEIIAETMWQAREYAIIYPSTRQLYRDGKSVFEERLITVFSEMLNFLIRARIHFSTNTICRHVATVLHPLPTTHQANLTRVVEAKKNLVDLFVLSQQHVEQERMEYEVRRWLQQPSTPNAPVHSEHGLLPNSGKWLLNHDKLVNWRSQLQSRLLWVSGIPGCGKTVLTQQLSQSLSDNECARFNNERNSEIVKVQFYCREGMQDADSPQAIMRSFLVQMLDATTYKPEFLRIIQDARITSGSNAADSLDVLTSLFFKLAAKIPRLYCLIDGLDECSTDDTSRQTLLEFLTRLAAIPKPDPEAATPSISAARGIINVFVTSRVNSVPTGWVGESDWEKIQVTAKDNADDIRAFVHERLKTFRNLERSPPERVVEICDHISKKSEGMFLWAELVLEEVQESASWDIDQTLKALPTGLQGLYDAVFQRMKRTLSLKVYQRFLNTTLCIAVAARPIRTEELMAFLALIEGAKNREAIDEFIRCRSDELQKSSLFVIDEDTGIHLVHSTLRQYFLKLPSAIHPPLVPLDLVSDKSTALEPLHAMHRDFAILCVRYLQLPCFADELPASSTEDAEKMYPLLRYASTQVMFHTINSQRPSSYLLEPLQQFFNSPQGWRWMQRLLGQFGHTIGHVQVFQAKLNEYLDMPGSSESLISRDLLLKLHEDRHLATTKLHGSHHPKALLALFDLAMVCKRQRHMDRSLELFQEALTLNNKVYGAESLESVEVMSQMASIYLDRQDTAVAMKLYNHVLDARKKILGEQHPDTLATLNAITLGPEGYHSIPLKDALEVTKSAFESQLKAFGNDHSTTLATQVHLGLCYYELRRLEEAEDTLTRAIERLRPLLGEEHPETIQAVGTLSRVLRERGQLPRAEELSLSSYNTLYRVLGPRHPQTLAAVARIAWVYQAQGRLEEALGKIEEAVDGLTKEIGPDKAMTVKYMDNKANILRKLNRLDEAETLYQEVIWRKQACFGEDHPGVCLAWQGLAGVYMDKGEYEKALQNLNLSVNGLVKMHGDDHDWTISAKEDRRKCEAAMLSV